MNKNKRSIVVLISGNGSNLQALIDHAATGGYKIAGVISNKADAYGLSRAKQGNIPTTVIDHRHYKRRDLFDQALAKTIDSHNPGLLVLAGFMRILGADFVKHYQGRMLNIHPSLLPDYPGTNTHQRVLDAGEKRHGVSVHFVTEELDGGPVIAQKSVNIEAADTADTLKIKIHEKERLIYPLVVSWFAAGRLELISNKIYMDGKALAESGAEVCVS